MAGLLGVDTSTYPKAQPQKGPLEVMGQVNDVMRGQQSLMQARMDMQRQRLGEIGNAAASLLPLGDKITMDHVRDKVYGLVDMGIVDAKSAAAFMQQAQAQGGSGGPGLFRFAQQTSQAAIGAAKAMEQQMGQFGIMDTGSGLTPYGIPGMLGPNGKALPVYGRGPEIVKGLTPGEAASGVPEVDERGQVTRTPLGDVTRPAPRNPLALGQQRLDNAFKQPFQPGIEAPRAASPTGGPVKPQVRSEVVPQPTPMPPAEPTTIGTRKVVTALGPENQTELQAQGETAVGIKGAAANAVMSQRGLADIREALKHIKTGGGAELRSNVAQVFQAIGAPKEFTDKIGNGSLPWGQVFDKQAMDVVSQTINSRFGGKMPSNLEFGTFMNRFPNINTDKQAVVHMIEYFDTINRMAMDKAKAYQAYKDKGFDMRKFETGVWIPYVSGPRSPYKMPGQKDTAR